MRAAWQNHELAALRALWPAAPRARIIDALAPHTPRSIKQKATVLGLRRAKGRPRGARKGRPLVQYRATRELHQERQRIGLSRADVAERSGYHETMLGRWERGERAPSLRQLADWAGALGMEVTIKRKALSHG